MVDKAFGKFRKAFGKFLFSKTIYMSQQTETELSVRELADRLNVSPQMINTYRRRIEQRTNENLGQIRGKTTYFTVAEQDAIRAEKATGTERQREAQQEVSDQQTCYQSQSSQSFSQSIGRIQEQLTLKADDLSTEMAVQFEAAVVLGVLSKIGNVNDPRLDSIYNAMNQNFDCAILKAQEIVGNVLLGATMDLPLLVTQPSNQLSSLPNESPRQLQPV